MPFSNEESIVRLFIATTIKLLYKSFSDIAFTSVGTFVFGDCNDRIE